MTELWRAFQALIPLGIVGGVALIAIGAVWPRLSERGRKIAGGGFCFVVLLGELAVTLRPRPPIIDAHGVEQTRTVDLVPFRGLWDLAFHSTTWHVLVEQIIGNVLLFIPLGVGIAMITGPAGRTVKPGAMGGLVVGAAIEIFQWLFGVGRVSSVDDVLLAIAGSVLGYAAGRFAVRGAGARRKRSTSTVTNR